MTLVHLDDSSFSPSSAVATEDGECIFDFDKFISKLVPWGLSMMKWSSWMDKMSGDVGFSSVILLPSGEVDPRCQKMRWL
jgi:hypothetical protein